MVIHRALADGERPGDLLVGQPLGHQLNDLQLSLREIALRTSAHTHTLFSSPDHHSLTLEWQGSRYYCCLKAL